MRSTAPPNQPTARPDPSLPARDRAGEVLNRANEVMDRTDEALDRSAEVLHCAAAVLYYSAEVLHHSVEALHRTGKVSNLTSAVLHCAGEVSSLTGEVSNRTDEASNCTGEASNLTDEVANLTDEVANLTNEVANCTGEASNRTDEVANGSGANRTGSAALRRAIALLLFAFVVWSGGEAIAAPCPDGMVYIPGGSFKMGAENKYIEERPAENVAVDAFCIDRHEITNAEFAEFVAATGYVTVAERELSVEQFPDLAPDQRAPGSLTFEPPDENAQRVPYLSWWHWTPGANWQHPYGPGSDLRGKADHPVVHVAYEDAEAYARWTGKQLPSEAQWEFAARGGLNDRTYAWGDVFSPQRANTWQGLFPFFNSKEDGYTGTAPVASFPPNGYGLYDMTGNVWEWTSDWFAPDHRGKSGSRNPVGPVQTASYDPKKPAEGALHVIKGGSHLCAKNYCSRYRPAARESQSPDTGTTHIGFRLVSPLAGADT